MICPHDGAQPLAPSQQTRLLSYSACSSWPDGRAEDAAHTGAALAQPLMPCPAKTSQSSERDLNPLPSLPRPTSSPWLPRQQEEGRGVLKNSISAATPCLKTAQGRPAVLRAPQLRPRPSSGMAPPIPSAARVLSPGPLNRSPLWDAGAQSFPHCSSSGSGPSGVPPALHGSPPIRPKLDPQRPGPSCTSLLGTLPQKSAPVNFPCVCRTASCLP